jgi:hypothetical protein
MELLLWPLIRTLVFCLYMKPYLISNIYRENMSKRSNKLIFDLCDNNSGAEILYLLERIKYALYFNSRN